MKDNVKDIIITSLKEAFRYTVATFYVLLVFLMLGFLTYYVIKLLMAIPYAMSIIILIVTVFMIYFTISFVGKCKKS